MPELIVRKWDGPYGFMIFREYGVYKARRGDTGEVQFEDPDAEVVIRNAINSVLPGGEIFVKNTALPTRTGLTISKPVNIIGESKAKTIFQPSENVDCFTVTSDDVTIKNLKIEHQATGTGEAVKIGSGVKRITLDNLYITNGYHGIEARGNNIEDLTIKNCYLSACARHEAAITVLNPDAAGMSKRINIINNRVISPVKHGIQVYCSEDKLIRDVIISGNIIDSPGEAGVWGAFITNAIFKGNIIRDAGKEPLDIERSSDISIEGNVVIGGSITGITVIQIGTDPCERILIKNNIIVNPALEAIIIKLVGTADSVSSKHINIEGNNILANQHDAIRLFHNVQYVNIIGNLISRTTAAGNNGIRIDPTSGYIAEHINVENNIVKGFSNGIAIWNTDYQSIKYVNIVGNNLQDNTNAISYDGRGLSISFAKNQGYITENSGIVTIPSGQTSVTFAHGLAGAPTTVVLGATHAEVADAVWSADDTNITITVPSAVSADRQIGWYAKYKP